MGLILCGNYDAQHGTFPVSDAEIIQSTEFSGWKERFLEWTTHPCRNRPELKVVPMGYDYEVGHHAYHIRRLAAAVLAHGAWIGEAVTAFQSCECGRGHVMDGSHRLRAVEFLRPILQVDVPFVVSEQRSWRPCLCGKNSTFHSKNCGV